MSLNDRPIDPHETSLATFDFQRLAAELRTEPSYEKNGKSSRALVRGQELCMVLSALKAGHELKPHHAPTSASVLVLEGSLMFCIHGDDPGQHLLSKLNSAVFGAKVQHSVKAVSDCLFLIILGGGASNGTEQ